MKKWVKRILKITGILFLVLILIALGILFYQRHTVLAVYFFNTNQNAKAIPHLRKVIRDPDDLNYRLWRSLLLIPRIYEEVGGKEICEMLIDDCDRILEPQPDDEYYIKARIRAKACMHYYLSREHYEKGDYEKAVDSYIKAHESGLKHCHIGEDYMFYKDKVIDGKELDPVADFGYYDILGKEFDKPLAFYDAFISKKPEAHMAYYYRGLAYSGKGEYEKAIADFSKMIEVASRDEQPFIHRGMALRKVGRYSEAFEDLSKGIDMCAGYYSYVIIAPALRDLGETCEKLGKIEEAVNAYKEFVKFGEECMTEGSDPDYSYTREELENAKERIKALEGV